MRKFFSLIAILGILTLSATSHAIQEIKIAFVAPEGSTWAKVAHEWDSELRSRSNGRLGLKIYSGGVLGDERDIVRKMRINQVQAAGLTGLGLGIINPSMRVLELPLLVRSYEEMDVLVKKLGPQLRKGFQEKGFDIIGWSETGFVNVFSNKPVATSADMKGLKMWAWEGDPVVKDMYARFEIVPIPLALPDVLTSLSTNLIDGVYAPPLGAIALQWHTKTKYMSDLKLADSMGGFIITKRALNSLPADLQSLLRTTGQKYGDILKKRIRTDNEKAYSAIETLGIKTIKVPKDEVKKIEKTSEEVWNDLAGKLYSKEMLNKVKEILSQIRNKQ